MTVENENYDKGREHLINDLNSVSKESFFGKITRPEIFFPLGGFIAMFINGFEDGVVYGFMYGLFLAAIIFSLVKFTQFAAKQGQENIDRLSGRK